MENGEIAQTVASCILLDCTYEKRLDGTRIIIRHSLDIKVLLFIPYNNLVSYVLSSPAINKKTQIPNLQNSSLQFYL